MTPEQLKFLDKLVSDLAKALPAVEKFGTEEDDANEIMDTVYDAIGKEYPEMKMYSGISKLCIIVPELPFAVKIPYTGIWEYYQDLDDCCSNCEKCTLEVCCYKREGQYEFSEFYCDYCDKEIRDYEEAVEICPEAAEILIPTEYYATQNGHKFYLQEKVNVYHHDDEITKHPVYRRRARLIEDYYRKKHYYINNQWSVKAIQFFGAQKFFDFVGKLYYVENIFGDLHSGNLGYRLNGAPCILDFAGFNN